MKIDLVYTWIDGKDPKIIEKINRYQKNMLLHENPKVRFEPINEIFYSIKTALKYLPWINKIYIVTDEQIPPMDEQIINSDKIIIVDHKTIIPKEYLPTFYSDVIESFLHNIPDLSEIFLYNNDDFFFLDYIDISDILLDADGIIQLKIRNIFNINIIKKKTSEYSKRIVKTFYILKEISDKKLINNHHTKILRKSTLKYVEHEYKNLLHELRIHKFRNSESIQYLFFVMNIDNMLYDNIIIDNPEDTKEYHFSSYDFSEKLLYRFDVNKKYKFACFNSMNETFIDIFNYYINHFI